MYQVLKSLNTLSTTDKQIVMTFIYENPSREVWIIEIEVYRDLSSKTVLFQKIRECSQGKKLYID